MHDESLLIFWSGAMRYLYNFSAILLGLIFNVVAWNYFLHFFSLPPPAAGSPPAIFLGAMISSGYFSLVKTLEILGGLLVVFPKSRNAGLLILGPIIVNILSFHIFLERGAGLLGLPLLVAILALLLLFERRSDFARLLRN